MNKDKWRLKLRSDGSPKARSFKFSDTIGPNGSSRDSFSPRASTTGASALGSPRGSMSMRGVSAGKMMAMVRGEIGTKSFGAIGSEDGMASNVAVPTRRGSDDSVPSTARAAGRSSPALLAREASPRLGRTSVRSSSGGSWFGAGRESMYGFVEGEDEAADDVRNDLAALAATVVGAAEDEAEVDVVHVGGVGPNGRTRPLSPRVRDSDWLDGLSPRMAERGGSRLFPTHLTTPHAMGGGSTPGSARMSRASATPAFASSAGSGSTGGLCSAPSSKRVSKAESIVSDKPDKQKRSPRRREEPRKEVTEILKVSAGERAERPTSRFAPAPKPEGIFAEQGRLPAAEGLRPELPSWAAPRGAPADATGGTGGGAINWVHENGRWHSSRGKEDVADGSGGNIQQDAIDSGSSIASSKANRLHELRSKLEKSLRAAEQGLHADLKLLDQRLAAARRNSMSA